ncbi:MAG: hypothetical protein ABSC17_08340 [Thermacetogeniaceae bacterium]
MKPLSRKSIFRLNGSDCTPLRRGMAASFSLLFVGLTGALVYALASSEEAVWLSSFCIWWVALSCCFGGLIAGLRGGPGVWWPAGQIGVLGGGLILVLLALLAPEGLGFGDLLIYVLLPAGLSCGGALAGANLQVRSARSRAAGAGRSKACIKSLFRQ